ncbi:MAG: gephyrin-like molybdotransferase Glp [Nitrospinota bacterium]|nr:gephyrin-like molybdotransferase Glp [Nitrospinota bacterium]
MEFFKVVSSEKVMETITEFFPLKSEVLDAGSAISRILSEDIYSPVDLPDFSRATMDGYALNASDTFGTSDSIPAYLEVIGHIQMGEAPKFKLQRGQAAKISTGGMLPEGSDCVIMQEYTNLMDEKTLEVLKTISVGENMLSVGDDLKKGEKFLTSGTPLKSHDIGALFGVGITEVQVSVRPKIAILPTGDELVGPGQKTKLGQIRDINRFSLAAAVTEMDCIPIVEDILPDNLDLIKKRLQKVIGDVDIVLVSGGSSMGMRDYTVSAINSLGDPGVLIHGVSIKPGKPTIIGRLDIDNGNKILIGIPGHPVSAMMIFHKFVVPVIRRLRGEKDIFVSKSGKVHALLSRNLPSASGREDMVRVSLKLEGENFVASPLMGNSAMISTMTKADGYVIIPSDFDGLVAETEVEVLLY